MSQILIVTGSVRPNSVNKSVVEAVKKDLEGRDGVTVTVANLAELQLPFFDAPTPPSVEGFVPPHENVKQWGELVTQADGVVLVAPEYNHSLSAVLKNALDWLYKEWAEKPAAFVGYGWYAGANSHANLLAMNANLKLKLGETYTGLQFKKDLELDGSFLDEAAVRGSIRATLDELLTNTK